MSAFLLDSELEQDLADAKKYSEQWQLSYPEYERLAANLPSPDLPEHYTKVTDGTYSALLAERPMRVWGQFQTGKVVALPTDNADYPEWKTALVDVIWTNRIIKNANTMASFQDKIRISEHKSGIYGAQPLFCFPVSNEHYTGGDFILANPRDVKIPAGYVSDLDAPRLWYLRHYDKIQLRGVIEAAKKAPKNNGWVVKKLEEIYNSNAFTERTDDKNYEEEGKSNLGNKVTFATCYQRGYKAPWITIYCSGKAAPDNIIRRETNYFKSGDIPLLMHYNRQNLVNPFGVSEAELSGPSQNVIDLLTAAHTVSTLQAVDPAIQVKGDVINDQNLDLNTLSTEPRNLMFTGDTELEWFTPDKGILQAFPDQITFYKTNVMNQLGTGDGTASGTASGNTMYSKTHAGIEQQNQRTDTRDNYRRQVGDQLITRLANILINMTIQLTEGTDIIPISDEQRDKLVAAGFKVPEDAARVVAEFEELKDGEFEFEVDAGTSKLEDDDATKRAISEAIEQTVNIQELDARLSKEGKKFNLAVLLAGYYNKSGLDNVDKIITDLDPSEQQLQETQEATMQEQADAELGAIKAGQEQEKLAQQQLKTQEQAAKTAEAVSVPQEDINADTSAEDEIVAARLREQGWSDEQIANYFNRVRSV